MPSRQAIAKEQEKKAREAEKEQIQGLKEALSKLSFADLKNEDAVFGLLTGDFPAVRRPAFHDCYVAALDAADVAQQKKDKADKAAEANKKSTPPEGGTTNKTNTAGGQGTKPPATTAPSGDGSPKP